MKFFDSIGVDEKTWDEARYETAHHVLSWVVLLERILCYRQILDVVHIIGETHCSVDLLWWWLESPDVELKFGKGGPEWDVENRPEGLSINFVSFINHFIINKIKHSHYGRRYTLDWDKRTKPSCLPQKGTKRHPCCLGIAVLTAHYPRRTFDPINTIL